MQPSTANAPAANPPPAEEDIDRLVARILVAKQRDAKADTSALEREIDKLVYALYGLTPEEKPSSKPPPNDSRQTMIPYVSHSSMFRARIRRKDALAGKHGEFDIVLANPPFGKKSSVTIVNGAREQAKESLVINRDDFWTRFGLGAVRGHRGGHAMISAVPGAIENLKREP